MFPSSPVWCSAHTDQFLTPEELKIIKVISRIQGALSESTTNCGQTKWKEVFNLGVFERFQDIPGRFCGDATIVPMLWRPSNESSRVPSCPRTEDSLR